MVGTLADRSILAFGVATVLVATPVQAQQIDFFTPAIVEQVITELDLKSEPFDLSDGNQAWRVEFADGFVAQIHMRACKGENCRGLGLYAFWNGTDFSAVDLQRYHENYVFARVYFDRARNRLAAHHYIISDGGTTIGNLREYVRVFGDLAPRIPGHIEDLRDQAAAEEAETQGNSD